MDDALKRRLVGAVVLVSLAVIFVPMLVEDEPVVSPGIKDTNIPPRPVLIHPGERQPPTPRSDAGGEAPLPGTIERPLALPLPEMVEQAPEAEKQAPPSAPGGPEAQAQAPVASAPAGRPEPPPEPEPESGPEPQAGPVASAPATAPRSEPAEAPPQQPRTQPPAQPPESGSVDTRGRPSGWVVQVGSFASRVNAETTLAKLREAGFDSFQEEIRVGDKVLYRVGVGPEIDRARAEQQQAQIAETINLKGIVRRYP